MASKNTISQIKLIKSHYPSPGGDGQDHDQVQIVSE